MEYFKFIDKVKYEGKDSKNPMSFRYYDKDRVIMGKKMSEHLPFAAQAAIIIKWRVCFRRQPAVIGG